MVGEILKKEREKQHLSIDDIAAGTSIRALYIEAIEEGHYDRLPAAVYVKGFIRNYAKHLGLDSEAMVAAYHEEQPQAEVSEAIKVVPERSSQRRVSLSDMGKDEVLNSVNEGNIFTRSTISTVVKVFAALLCGTALVAGGMEVLATINNKPSFVVNEAADTKNNQDNSAAATADNKDAAADKNSAADNNAAATPADKVTVSAKFIERCWLQVVTDGNVVFEGTLDSGANQSWQGNNAVVIHAGNAGAMELTVNGKNLGKAGKVGEVAEFSFDKNSHTKPLPTQAAEPAGNTNTAADAPTKSQIQGRSGRTPSGRP